MNTRISRCIFALCMLFGLAAATVPQADAQVVVAIGHRHHHHHHHHYYHHYR